MIDASYPANRQEGIHVTLAEHEHVEAHQTLTRL